MSEVVFELVGAAVQDPGAAQPRLADASLVVLAERLGVTEILTIDRADFDVYRLSGNRRFVQVLAA